MSRIYDSWERVVTAVLRREQDRQIAFSHSRDPSSISSSTSSSFDLSFRSTSQIDDDDHHRQSLVLRERRSPSPVDYSDFTLGHHQWKTMLPPNKREVAWKSASLKVVFLPVEARELMISYFPEEPLRYSTRFIDEAVEVKSVLSFDIRGKIRTRLLTSMAIYGAYIVFKLDGKLMGFESAKAMIRFVNYETDEDAERRARIVHLQPVDEREREGEMAVERGDGCMEVRIGSFYVDEREEREVEARLMETSSRWKTGLVVEGIEFRPLLNVKQV